MGALVLTAVTAAIAMTHLDAVRVNNNIVLPAALVLEITAARARQFVKMTMMKPAAQSVIPQMKINDSHVTTWALPEGAIARLGRGKVRDVAFSPTSAHLAIATDIGLWKYELPSMRPVALWETERGMVTSVAFSNNGQWVATRNLDGIVKVCHTQNLQCVAKIEAHGDANKIARLAISADGQRLATSSFQYGPVCVWCPRTGTCLLSFNVEEPKRHSRRIRFPLSFSPDGHQLAYVSANNAVSVRHSETGEHIARLTGHTTPARRIAFSPCGEFLVASSLDNKVQVWNVRNESLEIVLTDYSGYQVIPAYAAEGTLRIADVYEDKVVIWDMAARAPLATFKHHGRALAACFSADGLQFAIASTCEFHVWEAGNSSAVCSLPGHTGIPTSVFFQTSRRLVSKYWENSGIVFWNIAEKYAHRHFRAPIGNKGGKACALSPCEELLANSIGQTIEVFRVSSEIRIAQLTEHQRYVTALAFSPTGKAFASGDDKGNLYLWDVPRWEKVHTLVGHTKRISAVTFHPDGKRLVTASQDNKAWVWDVKSGKQLASLPLTVRLATSLYKGDAQQIRWMENWNPPPWCTKPILPVAFSPDGTLIAGGLLHEIRFWDATTYEILMGILMPDGCQRPYVLTFSPCGRYLASGSWWQGTQKVSIRLWDIATGENIATFWGHPTDVQTLAFSPEGELLASGSFDGTILLWDMKPYLQQNETS